MLLLGLCLLTATSNARAQARPEELPDLARDWTMRLGLFVFNSETARKAAGNVGLSAIMERTVYYGAGYDVNIGIGYQGFDRVYSVPISVTAIARQHRLRWGVGTGYSFGKRIDGSGSSGPILSVLAGWALRGGRNPLSAELRYNFISGSNNELDGYSLTLGLKF